MDYGHVLYAYREVPLMGNIRVGHCAIRGTRHLLLAFTLHLPFQNLASYTALK